MGRGVGKCRGIPMDCIEIISSLYGDGFSSLVDQDSIPYPPVAFLCRPVLQQRGIHIMGYKDLGNVCGLASFTYDSAGALEWCTVKVNFFHDDMNCARVTDTITHEIGYCIGAFKHTTDGGDGSKC